MRRSGFRAGLAAGALGCGGAGARPAPTPVPADARVWAAATDETPRGLSDLAADATGALWAPAERHGGLFRLDPAPGGELRATEALPWAGEAPAEDRESLAFGPDGTVWLGLEAHADGAAAESLLRARAEDGRLVPEARVALPWAPFGVAGEDNHGVEALCVIGDTLLAVAERRLPDGAAPAWQVGPTGDITALRLPLPDGRAVPSALACAPDGAGGAHLTLLVRHYGAAALLRFAWPAGGAPTPAGAEDLTRRWAVPLNLEGLAPAPGGGWLLLTDNDSGGLAGPTRLIDWGPTPTP